MVTFKYQSLLCVSIILLLSVTSGNLAHAADKKDKDARRNAQMIQQMRQQQAQLEAEKQAKDAEIAEKEKALQEANQSAAAAGGNLNKAKSQLSKTSGDLQKAKLALVEKDEELLKMKEEFDALKLQYEQSLADLSFNDQQRKSQVETVAQATKQLNACTEKNQQLYTHAKSLIEIYEKPSLYQQVMRSENFFQLKRVELENILQNKLDQVDDAKVNANQTL